MKQLPMVHQLLLIANVIGLGFHPDTEMNDYITAKGDRLFSDLEAYNLNLKLEQCFEALGDDIYNLDWNHDRGVWEFNSN